jgi:hypothetical protein
MRHGGPALFTATVMVGLFLLLTLRSRKIWLPGNRLIDSSTRPVAFWSIVGGLALLALCLLGLIALEFASGYST